MSLCFVRETNFEGSSLLYIRSETSLDGSNIRGSKIESFIEKPDLETATEFIKDNLISIFNDLSNNYSNFTEETCNMIEDHKIVNEMIKDLLPIMVYYSFGKN